MDSLVTTEWLSRNRNDTDLRILDCTVAYENKDGVIVAESGEARWEAGHIPGSAFVDLLTDIADQDSELRYMMPPRDQFVAAMENVGIGEGTRVVLYDSDKSMWAARVWWMLKDFGFEDVAVLDGGWVKWTAEDREVSMDPPVDRGPITFIDHGSSGLLVTKNVVVDALTAPGTVIVNSLSAEQHNGETADYGRRGHIPGALNVPTPGLVNPDTHVFLAPEELRLRTAAVHEADAERVIMYCGGGISAASGAFVMARQSHENVVIYDGSMSEWAADPSLPLEY